MIISVAAETVYPSRLECSLELAVEALKELIDRHGPKAVLEFDDRVGDGYGDSKYSEFRVKN